TCALPIYLRDRLVEFRPVLHSRGLQVVDLGRDVRLAGDGDQLVDRLEQLVALAPDVRDVHATVLRGDARELDQLARLRVERRRVDQRGADAERTLLHGLSHQRAHALQLIGRGRPVLVADLVDTHRRRADERRDVRRDPTLDQVLEVLAQRGPWDVVLDVTLLLEHLLLQGLVQRTHGRALAEDLERDALLD